jgi:ribonuclease VapC
VIVVDASALLSVLLAEDGHLEFEQILASADTLQISAVNWFEVLLRLAGTETGLADAEAVRKTFAIAIAPVDGATVDAALVAHLRFGKGRHPAGLNLGDCFAYALAQSQKAPLLFKGADFAQTDVIMAHAAPAKPA